MNFDEVNNLATDTGPGHPADLEEQEYRYQQPSQEALDLPSAPLDPEWVSPFTLPPLPAFRKNRGPPNPFRSPEERLHQRSSSSAYYAAAWGSPYATPSPNRSPHPQKLRRRSQELETASPLSSRTKGFAPETTNLRETFHTTDLDRAGELSARKRSSSWDKSISLHERFNWLSESDLSGSEADIRAGKTPTKDTYLKSLLASVDKIEVPKSRMHQVQESIATITPETFNAISNDTGPYHDIAKGSQINMEQSTAESMDTQPSSNNAGKPLPSLPSLSTDGSKIEAMPVAPSPDSPSRPRMQSMQSFQRPKRKVLWKGKTCIIALPLTDRESAGLPPLLSSDEVRKRMQRWITEGYDIGNLMIGGPQDISDGFGQSRSLFPDPHEIYAERKNGKLHVHIPDQGEWDAWVEYLKEEKLRALGVTPSNSEPPMSVQSPFSSTLSRVSSTYPSIAASPPISNISTHGNSIRIASNTFSPPLGHPGVMSSRSSHVTSPSISGYPGPMHGYKQSIAQPRLTSPYDYPISHPGSFGPAMRTTPGGYGVRQFSPPTTANLQSFGQILSPMIATVPSNDSSRGVSQNPTMDQIRQQQQRQQHLHQHMMQHQRQHSYFPPPQSKSADQLPRTPIHESPSRHTPEIMHPTPRSHRHNLSAALQKGIDEAEAARSNVQSVAEEGNTTTESQIDDKSEETSREEEHESELPVLKRPETLVDGDEKSEIETNPSIAASPMLMDDQNPFSAPFTSLPQIKDGLQPQSQHATQSSISKLNVEAPVFDPTGRFSSSQFSFSGNSFQPTATLAHKPLIGGSRPSFMPNNMSMSKLNVDAPSFTPSFIVPSAPAKDVMPIKDTPSKQSIATPSKSSFTFSSPIFNVDAPEFKPGQSFSFTANTRAPSHEVRTTLVSDGSIFGSISIDPYSKVSRRGGKPAQIARPKSSEGTETEIADDEEGRVSAPSDRQKRARRVDDDEDEALLFASSAPFDHNEGLSSKREAIAQNTTSDNAIAPEPTEDTDNEHRSLAEKQHETEVEPEPASAQEDLVAGSVSNGAKIDDEISTAVIEHEEHAKAVASENDNELHDISEDDAGNLLSSSESLSSASEPVAQKKSEPVLSTSHISHKPAFSLSALAKPFEFNPGATSFLVPQQTSVQSAESISKGTRSLMASRFAAVSPEIELPVAVGRNNSPPRELYEYIRPEDADLDRSVNYEEIGKVETPALDFTSTSLEATPQLVKSIEESMRSEMHARAASQSPSQSSKVEEPMPSYEEIDAVMKQFEVNPDLGVERDDTPIKSTPLVDMRLPTAFRSDAPSPSPRRMAMNPQGRTDWGLGIHRLNDGNEEVSDWNHEFSPRQEDKLQAQAQYFDSRVNHLVGGILETRLVPLEQTLQTIQGSLVNLLDKKSKSSGRRSLSTENKETSDADDADDEDDYDAFEGFSSYRSRSPGKNQRKADKIRTIVMDAMSAYQLPPPEQPAVDMSQIHAALDEMRQLSQKVLQVPPLEQPDIRGLMEDVISTHPHFTAMKKHDDQEVVVTTYKLKVDSLEASLREANQRFERESALRQQVDEDMKQKSRRLLETQQQAMLDREAADEAQSIIEVLEKDKEAYRVLQSKHVDILENNKALEDTIAEYRVTSDQFRDEIKLERARNQDLIRRMHNLRQEFNEKLESRQALRNQMERLQGRMTQVMQDVHSDEAEWRRKEHDLIVQNKTTQAALDHEVRHREKIELQLDGLEQEHKVNMGYKSQHERAQQEILRLQQQVNRIGEESTAHHDKSFRLERELAHAKDVVDGEVMKATSKLQSELEAARATVTSLQSDFEAQNSRLQKRLDDAELDLEEQKAKHDNAMTEAIEAHQESLHEANQKREDAVEEQRVAHERKLNDLRERHGRALHNSSDDRHRLEYQLNEKLAIHEDRTKHLESQVKDLEERLETAKAAARAAAEAASAKAVNIPTPAPSVNASPPQRVSSASLQLVQGTDIPAKISPQALRESIIVLQDQLQDREQTIEQLEAEIAAVDKNAPTKLKERDNEIALLRELLSVRVDDLDEIIATLSQPNFDQETTKNAAIRLKANLQMEQQLKERAANGGGLTSSLPSISSISNFAQSPRGLPMAAAAAWGNWRKARDYSISAVSDIASNISQTPAKPIAGSPPSFLAGIMTPPSTSQRTPSPSQSNPLSQSSTRPLAAAAAIARKNGGLASEARPLRIYSTQPRALASRQAERRRESIDSNSSQTSKRQVTQDLDTPTTPTISRNLPNLDLGEDIDEDASLLDASEHGMDEPENTTTEPITV